MVKVGYYSRFTSGINKTNAVKINNIEKSMADKFHDAFRLTFADPECILKHEATVAVESLNKMERESQKGQEYDEKNNNSH